MVSIDVPSLTFRPLTTEVGPGFWGSVKVYRNLRHREGNVGFNPCVGSTGHVRNVHYIS